jgi:uncharacterized membrane protein
MSLFAGIKSFLIEKFWQPVTNESVFYNPFNTALYAAIFAIAAAYIGRPLLEKLDVDLNREFFIGITPYIFLGGAARSLKDQNILNTVLLETPFIYIVMFSVVIGVLLASRLIDRYTDLEYYKVFSGAGLLLLLGTLSLYSWNNLTGFIQVAGIYTVIVAGFYGGLKAFKEEYANEMFFLPIAGHYLDGVSSFVAIGSFGAKEKHVLGRIFIDLIGPAGMLVMKTLIIVPVVYIIYNDFEGDDRRYYLFLVAVLGFALGTRNLISLVA